MPDLILEMPAVPEGFCNSLNDANWVQTLINLVAQGVAKMEGSGFSVVMKQATAPSANDRDNLWYDTDVGRMYHWDVASGAWIAPHPEEAGGDARRWWTGTLTDLITYDVGSAGAVAASSGPMWEEDTDFQGRSPMGPGAIPTSDPAKVLTIGENYGEGAHTLTLAQLPSTVTITAPTNQLFVMSPTGNGITQEAGADWNPSYSFNPLQPTLESSLDSTLGSYQAHQTVHPVRGIYCLKRTARLNYVGA